MESVALSLKLIGTGEKVDPLTLSETPLKLLSPPLKAWLPIDLAMHTTHGCALYKS